MALVCIISSSSRKPERRAAPKILCTSHIVNTVETENNINNYTFRTSLQVHGGRGLGRHAHHALFVYLYSACCILYTRTLVESVRRWYVFTMDSDGWTRGYSGLLDTMISCVRGHVDTTPNNVGDDNNRSTRADTYRQSQSAPPRRSKNIRIFHISPSSARSLHKPYH